MRVLKNLEIYFETVSAVLLWLMTALNFTIPRDSVYDSVNESSNFYCILVCCYLYRSNKIFVVHMMRSRFVWD